MLDAFADGEDRRVGGPHGVIHDDAAIAVEACVAGERDVGPDARRHHDEIGLDRASVLQLHALHGLVADNLFRRRACQHLDAAPLELAPQEKARRLVELALHQRFHEVDDGHFHTERPEPVRRLEAEQAAADDDGSPAALRRPDHTAHILDVAEGDDAVERRARHRQDEGSDPVAIRSRS